MAFVIFAFILFIIEEIFSVLPDVLIFNRLATPLKNKIDKFFLVIFAILFFIIEISFEYLNISIAIVNIEVTFIEALILYIFFGLIRKNNKRMILGAILIFVAVDLLCMWIQTFLEEFLKIFFSDDWDVLGNTLSILIVLFAISIIYKFSNQIKKLIVDQNSSIFLGVLAYIDISGQVLTYYLYMDKRTTETVSVSLSLLFFQILFAILIYIAIVRIQRNLLTRQEQKRQKLELKLANANKKVTEARNQELILKEKQLQSQNDQLKEYSTYLEQNEDELRRFKHDYQNILNGLKVSAKEGKVEEVVTQLDKYTNTQFDQKALRKYKSVNRVHVEELKSIVITKLAKLYNLKINYSFGCEKDINHIPKNVDLLDLIRVIGITFDNAAEESEALIKQTGDRKSAKVDAMYYQEDGDFEFEIRNRVRKNRNNSDQFGKEGYTTKQHHAGIGLANVKEIAHKYEKTMFINYGIENGWFTFDLTILPDDENEED